jgi:trehalose 6-phosphate phosphatase
MSLPEPRTPAGVAALQAILDHPEDTLVGLDFDGTLAAIVDDPEQAYADPGAVAALGLLGGRVAKVVVITGRPTRQVVQLGRLTGVPGLGSMTVLGQYGVERWNAEGDEYVLPPDPPEIEHVLDELPGLLDSLDLGQARVEHKGRALGVHTRMLDDPAAAFARLAEPIRALAQRYALTVEPGKNVWEIRASGIDKGVALRNIVTETRARQVIFAGDDLGDLPAFRAALALREAGMASLLVCSASHEEDALAEISDVVVDGPPGITRWLTDLADALHR